MVLGLYGYEGFRVVGLRAFGFGFEGLGLQGFRL